jgi:hypothetical protein
VAAAGVVGLLAPDVLVSMGRGALTPTRLYVIAGLRICIGLLLILAAKASKMPRTVATLGIIVLVAGVVTPLFGVDRSVAVLDRVAQHPSTVRMAALILAAFGAFIIYVFRSVRRSRG